MFSINMHEFCDFCSWFVHHSMLEGKREEDGWRSKHVQSNIQIEDEDNGRLGLIVNLFERIFSIECLTSDAVVVGFVSMEWSELVSSSHSSVSSEWGFVAIESEDGGGWKKNGCWCNEK